VIGRKNTQNGKVPHGSDWLKGWPRKEGGRHWSALKKEGVVMSAWEDLSALKLCQLFLAQKGSVAGWLKRED